MSASLLLLEISAFTVLICAVHALKPRLGLAPLYLLIGMLEVFLFVTGKTHPGGLRIKTAMYFADPADLSYMLFLPLLLTSMVLVYVMEGTKEARRLLLGLLIVYLVHGVLDLVLANHAANPPAGHPSLADSVLVYYSLGSRLASSVAIAADFVVIIVSYQFVRNRLPSLPLVVPLFCALLLAMVGDAVVYSSLRPYRTLEYEHLLLFEKLQAGLAAGLPMALYLGWQLRRHSGQLSRGILERGAFEIIDLRQRMAQVQAELEHVRRTFGRYVSTEVVDALMADPAKLRLGGEEREVTILFADIRGYSTLAESLEPTEIIGLLNRYFTRVTTVILDQRGMINEFEGDAVLAVFGAPLEMEDHAERAVEAAVGMLAAVAQLNVEWEKDGTADRWRSIGIDGLAIRIGIHTGKVVAGNVGSEARTKYAVIGDTVNIASRVEGLNKELRTSLLITSTTHQALVNAHGVTDMGLHHVKGRAEPVQVYSVAD